MKITNNTGNDLEVQIQGKTYVLPANSHLDGVQDEHAIHWQKYIHQFIELTEEPKKALKEEIAEQVAEIMAEETPVSEDTVSNEEAIEEVAESTTKKSKK